MKHMCPYCGKVHVTSEEEIAYAVDTALKSEKNATPLYACECGESYDFINCEVKEAPSNEIAYNFHSEFIEGLEKSLLKHIHKGDIFKDSYTDRIDVMPLVKSVYKKMDIDHLEKLITSNLEEVVAKKIVDKLTTEMGTDIKQLMGNATVRDDFRFFFRTGIQKILDKIKGDPEKDSPSKG